MLPSRNTATRRRYGQGGAPFPARNPPQVVESVLGRKDVTAEVAGDRWPASLELEVGVVRWGAQVAGGE